MTIECVNPQCPANSCTDPDCDAAGRCLYKPTKIIAIDPGNTMSAVVTINGEKLLASGKVKNEEVLTMLRHDDARQFEILAVEMIASYGMAVGKEVFDTCVWIGRYVEAWASCGGKHRYVYRKDVKLYLCETSRATDSNIRTAIIDRYGPGKEKAIGTKREPGPLYELKGDTWSAFAVALTALNQLERDAKPPAPRSAAAVAANQPF